MAEKQITIPADNNKASRDSSEEGAHITSGAGTDEPLSNNNNSSSGDDSSGDGRRIINGHLDPKQRRYYLILFAFSVLNALVGLTLLLVWMLKYRAVPGFGFENAGQLANSHPIMMYTFMVSLNMYSVLIYRTHFDCEKTALKWTHAILSGTNIIMSLLGVAAMFKSHLMAGIPNFYSLHSWIGALTNAFYLSQFIFGFIAFLKPGLKQQQRTKLMPWHRLIGSMILVLAATAAITGISELVIFQDKDGVYSKFAPITFIANFAGLATIIMTTISIYLLTAPQYLRPTGGVVLQ